MNLGLICTTTLIRIKPAQLCHSHLAIRWNRVTKMFGAISHKLLSCQPQTALIINKEQMSLKKLDLQTLSVEKTSNLIRIYK